ncbi:cytochrome b561 domain-containing protein [Favolaschia claudopus]|uniref:Cytochrome b561 domain-containing protein n=1 Tax=Favolaschia claudopus TaxID=2862362 RepID=A0AAV9ZVQ7_9AGAR
MSTTTLPLNPLESKARIHAHVAFFAFLVGLPLGVLIARYLRTFTSSWFWPHAIVNFLFTGPLVFAGFTLGYQTTNMGGEFHFSDPHQKVGLALLVMYLAQVFLGAFIHWVKLPFRFPGGRHPQNYLHAILGLAIIVLTHYGLWIEWAFITGNIHPVNSRCKHFWLGIVVAMWSLYAIGLGLLPRQLKQEAATRRAKDEGYKDNVPLI